MNANPKFRIILQRDRVVTEFVIEVVTAAVTAAVTEAVTAAVTAAVTEAGTRCEMIFSLSSHIIMHVI